MNDKLKQILEQIAPFIIIGVGIAVFIGLLFMFFYVAVWGVLIGGALYLAALARNYFFPPKPTDTESGRIIEHDDKK